MRALRQTPGLEGLGELALSMLVCAGRHRSLPCYTQLYREGSAARSFWALRLVDTALPFVPGPRLVGRPSAPSHTSRRASGGAAWRLAVVASAARFRLRHRR